MMPSIVITGDDGIACMHSLLLFNGTGKLLLR